jgi:hypothetical protein
MESNICGFSTIAILPNIPKREMVFVLFIDGNPELYLSEPPDPIPPRFEDSLSDSHLSYNLIQPFGDWEITFQNPRCKANLLWHPRFAPYDFGKGSGVTWERHFEQSGYMKGYAEFPDGQRYEFKAIGQRDKSWGVRNWHIDEWFHIMAQFDDLMIGVRRDVIRGEVWVSGCVITPTERRAVIDLEVETTFEEGAIRKPLSAEILVRDDQGNEFDLQTRLIAPMTFARYARQFPTGETELFEEMVIFESKDQKMKGVGLAEWVFTHSVN